MELRTELRHSEVGEIPEDWNVEPLGKCLLASPEYGINAPAVEYNENLLTYIRITDITDDGRFSRDKRASVDHPYARSYMLRLGDLVFARTGASVGKSYLYDPADGSLVFAGFLIRIKPDPAKLCPDFLAAYVQSGTYWSWIRMMSMRSGQPGVNGREFAQLPAPCPPLAEQRAIAEVLSDADALIESLEQLITKKRRLKQGAMQELLTGQRRLPGFSGEWKVKQMKELGSIYGGLTGKSKSDFANGSSPYIPFLNIMNNPVINTENFDYVNLAAGENQNNVRKGDLLFNGTSETPEEVGMCSILMQDVPDLFLNSFCFGFRLNSALKTNGLYLTYFFRSSYGRQLLYSLAQGATRYNLSKGDFLQLSIPYPCPEEQAAIANIISDMDTEIAALETKLTKARQLKQGMMYNLLSGRIRLV